MKHLVILMFLFSSAIGFAQVDLGRKSGLMIPAVVKPETTSVTPNVPNTPNFDIPNRNDSAPLKTDSPINMFVERNLADPNLQYKKRLQAKIEEVKPTRPKQALGTVRTKLGRVIVRYRDSQAVDGDQVQISHNGNMILKRITLGGDYGGFELRLEMGYNYIDFKVLDEGTSGPNTAAYEVIDADGNVLLSSVWDLTLSDVASLVIIKER